MADESSLVLSAAGSSLGVSTWITTRGGASTTDFSRAEWARSREVQLTHYLCSECSAVRPREETVCSSCSMPRPMGADSSYKAVQVRREANLSSSQAASNISYLRQRQQDDASMSAGMGEQSGFEDALPTMSYSHEWFEDALPTMSHSPLLFLPPSLPLFPRTPWTRTRESSYRRLVQACKEGSR